MAKLGRNRRKIEDENGETLDDLRIQKAKRRDGETEYEIDYVVTPEGRRKNLGNSDDKPAAIFAYRQWKAAQWAETNHIPTSEITWFEDRKTGATTDRQGIELIAPLRSNRKKKHKIQDGRLLRRYKRRWTLERTINWTCSSRTRHSAATVWSPR